MQLKNIVQLSGVRAMVALKLTVELELEVVLNLKTAVATVEAGGRVVETDGGLATLSVESEIMS